MEDIAKEVLSKFGTYLMASAFFGYYTFKGAIKKWQEKRKQLQSFKQGDITNNGKISIDIIVAKIQAYTGCSRVNVFLYHNGVKDKEGVCFNFVTATSESCGIGIESIWNQFQNRQIEPEFRVIINNISNTKDGYLKVNAVDQVGEQRLQQKKYGIVTSYNFKLGKSVWEGVLTLSWINTGGSLTDEQIENIRVYVAEIKAIKETML